MKNTVKQYQKHLSEVLKDRDYEVVTHSDEESCYFVDITTNIPGRALTVYYDLVADNMGIGYANTLEEDMCFTVEGRVTYLTNESVISIVLNLLG